MSTDFEPTFDPSSLASLRKNQGWSQEELARRSGLATVTVVKLEQGKVTDPHVRTLARLANALGCAIETFLDGTSYPVAKLTGSTRKRAAK